MKLAAIDIGSNAVRLQITKVIEYDKVITFKKLEYVRFPLRLGHDVFSTGKISEPNQERFYKLMSAFKHLIDLYDVSDFYGCATSAMRESENGATIVEQVNSDLNLPIQIISGEEEADMINRVIIFGLDNSNYIHIDVGGGSTELNIYRNQKKVHARSFQIGTVRILENKVKSIDWEIMRDWIKQHALVEGEEITAVGTGGNINKLYELSGEDSQSRKVSLHKLERIHQMLTNLSLEDRLNKLQLNPDRADVIVPASKIYFDVMRSTRAKNILVPDVGLKDGINYYMYDRKYPNHGRVFVKN